MRLNDLLSSVLAAANVGQRRRSVNVNFGKVAHDYELLFCSCITYLKFQVTVVPTVAPKIKYIEYTFFTQV